MSEDAREPNFPKLDNLDSKDLSRLNTTEMEALLAQGTDLGAVANDSSTSTPQNISNEEHINKNYSNDDLWDRSHDDLDEDLQAEVVLVRSSLTVNKIPYFDSLRLKHLLDAKGVKYVLIDINKDFSKARGLVDHQLVECWRGLGLLYNDPEEESRPLTPQLLIDGISIGSLREAEDYEEDEDFDWCLKRSQCPACFHPRVPEQESCACCECVYQTLIHEKLIKSGKVLLMRRGQTVTE